MNNNNIKLPFPTRGRTDKKVTGKKTTNDLILEQLNYDKELWEQHGPPPPNAEFPKFGELENEVEKIKATIRANARKNTNINPVATPESELEIDFRNSGKTPGIGLRLEPRGSNNPAAADNPPAVDKIKGNELDQVILVERMRPYFDQAQQALEGKGEGIRHDEDGYWLPGLFLIDEIFGALLKETNDKIENCNAARKNSDWPTNAYKQTQADLDDFVRAISSPGDRSNKDAAKYVPFINYASPGQTYIKLLEGTDGYIVGAIVHVDDWAGGSHSSGSGIP